MSEYKHGNAARTSKNQSKKKISMWAIVLMSCGFVGAFKGLVENYIALGYSETPAFILAVFLYLLPFTFIVIEFVSLRKCEGNRSGLMKWVEVGGGRKLAFLTAFMFWFANLTFFLGALPGYINDLGFALSGKDVTKETWFVAALPWLCVLLFLFCTYLSTKGTKMIAYFVTVGGLMMLGIIFVFFFSAIGVYAANGATGGSYGYGGISEGGFYVNVNAEGGPTIVALDTGVWIPSESILTFDNQVDYDAFGKNASLVLDSNDDLFTGYKMDEGVGQFTVESRNGVQTTLDITADKTSLQYTCSMTYTSTESPFVLNPKLMDEGDKKGILFGSVGSMKYLWFATLVWVLMSCDGVQGLGVFADDVKGGRKQFSRGLLIGALMCGTIYIFGMFLISVFPGDTLANSTPFTIGLMFYYVFGNMGISKNLVFRVSTVIVGWTLLISGVGGLLIWTAAPVRTLFTDTDNGIFGSYITKKNENGIPYRGAWLQFFVVIPLLVIPYMFAGGINEFIWMIKTAGGSLGMIPPMLIFYAYFNLRLKHDTEERSFRMGSRGTGLAIGGTLFCVYIWIFWMAFFPYNPDNSAWWIGSMLNVTALVFVFFPVMIYYVWYEKKQRDTKIAIDNGYNPELILMHYSNDNKLFARKEIDIRRKFLRATRALKKDYDVLYDEVPKDSLSDKEFKKRLKEIDKKYKVDYKTLHDEFKLNQKENKLVWKEKGLKEYEKISPFVNLYKTDYKTKKAQLKADYKVLIDDAKSLEKNSGMKVRARNKSTWKEAYANFKEDYKLELIALKAGQKERKIATKEEYKIILENTPNKDNRFDLRGKRDAIIALDNLETISKKYKMNDAFKAEVVTLKAKHLGKSYQLKFDEKLAIKKAKVTSYKRKIEGFTFVPFTTVETIENKDYTPSSKAFKFDAIRTFASIRKPSNITDEIYFDNEKLVTVTRELDHFVVTTININDIEIYVDESADKIKLQSTGKTQEMTRINIINYDQYLALKEGWYIHNVKDFFAKYNALKEKAKTLEWKTTMVVRED